MLITKHNENNSDKISVNDIVSSLISKGVLKLQYFLIFVEHILGMKTLILSMLVGVCFAGLVVSVSIFSKVVLSRRLNIG